MFFFVTSNFVHLSGYFLGNSTGEVWMHPTGGFISACVEWCVLREVEPLWNGAADLRNSNKKNHAVFLFV